MAAGAIRKNARKAFNRSLCTVSVVIPVTSTTFDRLSDGNVPTTSTPGTAINSGFNEPFVPARYETVGGEPSYGWAAIQHIRPVSMPEATLVE